MGKPVDAETPRSVRLIEVIESKTGRGNGVDNAFRIVTQYWSKEGNLLGEIDPLRINHHDSTLS